MFPFGYGLSYSSFEYSNASINATPCGCEVVFTVKNIGKVDAMESAQIYVQPLNPSVIRPAYELKGFDKKLIAKGKSVEFRIPLCASDFSYYDAESHSWKVDAGDYKILVGSSSSDIRLTVDYTVR
jgi:beta-glucosidase